jgi:ATP phosphoribosyltransferase
MPGNREPRGAKMKKISQTKKILRIGLPKGSLEQTTMALFEKAGWRIKGGNRELFPSIDDPEIEAVMLRAQEMAGYVENGVLDCGLTGRDWVIEQGAKVKEICPLTYSKTGFRKVRWVVAVPADSAIKTPSGLKGKRIATEVIRITSDYLRRRKVKADVVFSWGATEAKSPLFADAIVEVTETGRSLAANNLRIIDTVMESETVLIANPGVFKNNPWKRDKIEILAMMLKGALEAGNRVGLKMNVPDKALKKVLSILPALHTPTLSLLSDKGWYSLEVIVEEKKVREMIPALKKAGAAGIIEYPLNKLIY